MPVLGTNSIEVYSRNTTSGQLTHIFSSTSPRGPAAHDGPRHIKIHPNGKVLYCVTEHCSSSIVFPSLLFMLTVLDPANFLDLYEITTPDNTTGLPFLKYIDSRSLLPSHLASGSLKQFRGDTLMLTPPTHTHPSPYALFTTTRGSTPASRGWLSIFALDRDGHFVAKDQNNPAEVEIRYETPSSGGKANAIDLLTRWKSIKTSLRAEDNVGSVNSDGNDELDTHLHRRAYSPFRVNETLSDCNWEGEEDGVWILLTDDDETAAAGSDLTSSAGGVKVLEWGGWGKEGVHVVAEWPEPPRIVENDGLCEDEGKERMMGGSHAIWLV